MVAYIALAAAKIARTRPGALGNGFRTALGGIEGGLAVHSYQATPGLAAGLNSFPFRHKSQTEPARLPWPSTGAALSHLHEFSADRPWDGRIELKPGGVVNGSIARHSGSERCSVNHSNEI